MESAFATHQWKSAFATHQLASQAVICGASMASKTPYLSSSQHAYLNL